MMAEYGDDYECALSGLTAEGGDPGDDSDGLGDLPVGWTEVRIRRRRYNPRWLMIQQVKQDSLEALLGQLPGEFRVAQELAIRLQIDAQFFGLENATPMFVNDIDDVVYVSDSADVLDGLNEVRKSLSLPPVAEDEDDEDDDVSNETDIVVGDTSGPGEESQEEGAT